ncbi:MAG: DUF962 domain-containing protein [Myxococcales bacterium]|nr:DUF962 domain-containing protein [Myxococcales bacterium]
MDYPRFHKNRTNLLLHIVVVPLFVLGIVYAVVAAIQGRWLAALLSLLLPLISLAIQGVGHKKEPNPPLPFEGPGEFVTRIFTEQFYRFPKFVLSGEWLRALRASR